MHIGFQEMGYTDIKRHGLTVPHLHLFASGCYRFEEPYGSKFRGVSAREYKRDCVGWCEGCRYLGKGVRKSERNKTDGIFCRNTISTADPLRLIEISQ